MATEDATRGRGPSQRGVKAAERDLPDRETCEKVLAKMLLIRRFEERAGEMYAKAKIGGFLHLCIGEEATIVGATQALRDTDYLMSTYREHGQALARGTPPDAVMAELFGKATGCSGGRGGSMHLFDFERRFLGGYGIVGGNLPLAAGVALASDYSETDDATLCMFGDGATNQGTFGETMNLAALWSLPVVFMVINNQFGMGTALERHSAVTDLSRKADGFGVPGTRCDGMDVLDTHGVRERGAGEGAHRPQAPARGGRDLPLPRPLDGRPRGVPLQGRGGGVARARPAGHLPQAADRRGRAERGGHREAGRRGDEGGRPAEKFADESPFPDLASLYDDVYVIGDQVQQRPWYSTDSRSPDTHRGEEERDAGDIARELAEAGALHEEPEEDEVREARGRGEGVWLRCATARR